MKILNLVFLMTIWSCNSSNKVADVHSSDCFSHLIPEGHVRINKDSLGWKSLDRVVTVGEVRLHPESLKFMPQFCLEIGDEIIFVNQDYDEKVFKLTDKSFSTTRSVSAAYIYGGEYTEVLGYHLEKEEATLELKSEFPSETFSIVLTSIPDINDENAKAYGDQLSIYSSKGNHIDLIVNQRSLSYDKTDNQQYYKTKKIFGTRYKKVYSASRFDWNTVTNTKNNKSWKVKSEIQKDRYKFYYNTDFGLFAYEDLLGNLWELVH